jgi:hypothetical protein
VKEKGTEKGKSRDERKSMRGTRRKQKQRKRDKSHKFYPTFMINELLFDLLENSCIVNMSKQGVCV